MFGKIIFDKVGRGGAIIEGMEKLPHQEYRDDVANKLNKMRDAGRDSKDPKSEITRAKAEGYLEAKKEDGEYLYHKKEHMIDGGILNLENDVESKKTLRQLRLEFSGLDKYLKDSSEIYRILHIPFRDGYYDFEKEEFVIEMEAHQDFQAYEGFTHGGVIAFLMDIGGGVASYIKAQKLGKSVVTKKIKDIEFHRPIKTGDKIRVIGKVIEFDGKDFLSTTTIYLKKGDREKEAVTGTVILEVANK